MFAIAVRKSQIRRLTWRFRDQTSKLREAVIGGRSRNRGSPCQAGGQVGSGSNNQRICAAPGTLEVAVSASAPVQAGGTMAPVTSSQ
jgi:hypothetical protein